MKPEDFSTKQLDDVELRKILQFSLWELESLEQWQRSRVEFALMSLAKRMGLKVRDFLAPLFVAVTGQLGLFGNRFYRCAWSGYHSSADPRRNRCAGWDLQEASQSV